MSDRWIYAFGDGSADAGRDLIGLVGAKGAGLADMTNLGLPVPPGFTITTEACAHFFGNAESWPDGLEAQLEAAVQQLEQHAGRKLGDADHPLLISVRSGAAVSMPGMMDTVLNLGLNDTTVAGLIKKSGDARFAWDSYRRFVQDYGDVVLGIHFTRFSRAQDEFLDGRDESELDAGELEALTRTMMGVIDEFGREFPQDPREQLRLAINGVFRSYNSHRARYYRKSNGIADTAGTAVTIQAMVFGNLATDSGAGTAFTRNPKFGRPGLFGEWLAGSQGPDLAQGTHIPESLESLHQQLPEAFVRLDAVREVLEGHYRDLQEIEFTVERGELFLLQTSAGKRTAQAAVRIVVDLVDEGLIDQDEALSRIDPASLELMLRPVISPDARRKVIAKGLDASPGAATGVVVFHAIECQDYFDRDIPTILVRLETSPEDIQGMTVSSGILTARGGQTSHAAVVARGMGKPCVVGCTDIQVDYSRNLFYAGDVVVRKGDWITIDGANGQVMEGKVEMLEPEADSGAMATLLTWADERARLEVRANADTGLDAARARGLGAVGVGLCRTEHMFFQTEALRAIRRMILADDPRSRQLALNDILPMQRQMFRDLFREMDGLPVCVRLLDPPLHEFLPDKEDDIDQVAQELGVRPSKLHQRLKQLAETNPMLGHRGVRIGVTTPEVYRIQVRAIFEAVCALTQEGIRVLPEVMIPLVAMESELERMRNLVADEAEKVIAEYDAGPLDYLIGTMIELPRAALTADALAKYADFFSFGTNDLTQMVFGFSRDDMGKFYPAYQREGLLPESPLSVFDVEGVGQLVDIGTRKGRSANERLKVGVCGEHGGDPHGIRFFHSVNVDYVSCSPYRVPTARLAAAHAAMGL